MKKVLFVCVENSCRSQIAEGIAKECGKGVIEAYSAGSKPSGVVNPAAIEVMKDIGIDISKSPSKGFSDLPVKRFDYVITLGCGDTCPFFPADKHIDWKIEDPKGKDMDFFRKTRNNIEEQVKFLIEEIKKEEV
ncbi:MAG: arsenate reductase ArsC [Candidatus Omnitrophica bacterium]|jgi:arsenate reductase|nr:arsenate reductase ArsC [Candidatus Omnitrophota bacterium]MDD4981457.1 arsenate reductase ArsC [Candidatus Omnitrophota bacterium]MDD5665246.1 arsenate reductase ArsC [Candidatus Omnitrophota bacterium]